MSPPTQIPAAAFPEPFCFLWKATSPDPAWQNLQRIAKSEEWIKKKPQQNRDNLCHPKPAQRVRTVLSSGPY